MLHVLAIITTVLTILSGLYVIGSGAWHTFGLKFAGVALSTLAAAWLLAGDIMFSADILNCSGINLTACLTIDIYRIVRNVAFIFLHVAVGRDAICYKKRDRRGAPCQMNSLNQSSR